MIKIIKFFFIFFFIFIASCQKDDQVIDIIDERDIDAQMISSYKEGLEKLETGYPLLAAKKFNEAELLYPQSIWAPRASLMAAYSYYSQMYYSDAIFELERYLKTYPNHNRKNYAYYLLGISHYDQIVDEKKDLGAIREAKKNFEYVIKNYPNSDFAIDAEFKLDLIYDMLAAKEMYLAKFYLEKEKWVPAINRYKYVLEKYETSIYAEEAIHRLVELNYKIGLIEESKKYASLLGYNYQSGIWYKKSYKIFNKNYNNKKKKKKRKKNKTSIVEKFKKLID